MPDYAHPPITEAIIDIQVKLPESIDLEAIGALSVQLSSEYPKRESRQPWTARIKVEKGVVQSTSDEGEMDGYLHTSSDGKQVVQYRLDGFTFNRLKPYPGWIAVSGEAIKWWTLYKSSVHPEAINRIAVRTINVIDLPQGRINLEDYFQEVPHVTSTLPHAAREFRSQISVYFSDFGCNANVTLGSLPSMPPESSRIVFDTDVYLAGQGDLGSRSLAETLEMLRKVKNDLFESTFTDRAKEMFA